VRAVVLLSHGRSRVSRLAAAVAAGLCVCLCFGLRAGLARAQVPAGMPSDVPAAASDPTPTLPEPSSSAWPFPSTFPQTSGTGRLADGASLWTDFVYDDYGASSLQGLPTSSFAQSSGLAARQGNYVFPPGPANNNGADIFRSGVGVDAKYSYWRVDWVTLADPRVPIAEWTLDTDNNASTGASSWPAGAGVTSAGIDRALVVSSHGAWLVNPVTGARTDVVTGGGKLTIDRASKSFIVAVPRSLLAVSGTWRIRLGAGLGDSTGQNFAAPEVGMNGSISTSNTAERLYNITFRSVEQEPPVYTDGMSDALIALAQARLAGNPIGAALGADGIARGITGNFWMEDDQADTLASGDVSKFSQTVDWAALAAHDRTAEPQPTGYSTRWYTSRLNPGSGQVINDGNEGNFKPTLLDRVQPYAVYVPTTYRPGTAMPLTWILHSLEVNYNQYGGDDPQLIQQLCQDRGSICATTEGFGPSGWYYNEAETDFWQVWRSLASGFTLDPARTVISGYSMGGWASYKLAFQHPDDFAGALVLDGPVVCGIGVYPGAGGPAFQDPACSKDGQTAPLVANARWIPYVIDQTYADELVPTPGVLAQAQAFDRLGQRYDLFIHTGGDHLAFAIEDRFSDVVTALGRPARAVNPGSFVYDWYPSLDSSALGIGATGDYWLSGLSARNRTPGVIAGVTAADSALPDSSVTAQRSGPSLVTQPMPGTETKLTWKLGPMPAAAAEMSLRLTDVAGLTVDAAAAKFPTGTIGTSSDGVTTLAVDHLKAGTQALEGSRVMDVAGTGGSVAVKLGSGRTVIVLRAPSGGSGGKGNRHRKPRRFVCAKPSGRLRGVRLGPVRLGMKRSVVRRHFRRVNTRGRRNMDFFCPVHRGIRVGYPSRALLHGISTSARRRFRGRAVLILTANRHYALHGVRIRTRVSRVAEKLHVGWRFQVGRNTWYLTRTGASRGVLKVRRGRIEEVGIADGRLTRTRSAARRFLGSFD
jgi:pimeloyl-ACP methyl ester carboxylesterase